MKEKKMQMNLYLKETTTRLLRLVCALHNDKPSHYVEKLLMREFEKGNYTEENEKEMP